MKVAKTDRAALIVTLQVRPETDVHPDHDRNEEPGSSAAASDTDVAGEVLRIAAVQASAEPERQAKPSGPVTAPEPVP